MGTSYLTEWSQVLLSSANSLLTTVAGFLPSLLGALLILLIGIIVAKGLKTLTRKIIQWVKLEQLLDKTTLNQTMQKTGMNKSVTDVIAALVYWMVMLVFFIAAADALALSAVVDTLNRLVGYLPNIIVAVIVLVLTFFIGKIVKDTITVGLEQIQASHSKTLASLAEGIIILFGILIAAGQLGFDLTILTTNITILIAGLVATIVLSFGLGAKNTASNLIAGYYTKQLFEKDQKVVLGGKEGTVTNVTNVAVTLKTSDGKEVIIPNNEVMINGSLKD